MPNLIVLEDDLSIATGLEYALIKEGHSVTVYDDGKVGYKGILHRLKDKHKPDLLILDIMLPGMNGYEVCESLRAQGISVPILMLTAKSQEKDLLKGLRLGADDYVVKPFSLHQLLARVTALLRRAKPAHNSETVLDIRLSQDCRVNLARHEVLRGRKKIILSDRENRLLAHFIKNSERVISREELLREVWDHQDEASSITTRTVDNFIVKLRKIIEKDPDHPLHLKTVYRAGYKLVLS